MTPRSRPRRRGCSGLPRAGWVAGVVAGLAGAGALAAQDPVPRPGEAPEAQGVEAPLGGQPDPAARLQARIDAGEVELAFDTVFGWLPSLLEALQVPVSSQTLVFSRTSLQTDRIGPWAPRALYFNDDVYVGYVQDGGLIEIGAVEPGAGAVFYSLAQVPTEHPRLQREGTTCLMCHASRSLTGGVPGFIVRSVLVDRLGYPVTEIHEGNTTERTPMERRWGGWYVTGTGAGLDHMANVWAPQRRHEVADMVRYLREFDAPAHRVPLSQGLPFDPSWYLSPHSDVVALSVLTHQVRVHNLLALAQEAAAEAARDSGYFGDGAGRTVAWDELIPSAQTRVDGVVARLVDALLFVGEEPWPAGVGGDSGFAADFPALGPADRAGRSLRDLELEGRLFRYPLSFLVHSPAFHALAPVVAERVGLRLASILEGRVAAPAYAHLGPEERRDILQILRDTEPELLAGGDPAEGGLTGGSQGDGEVRGPRPEGASR